MNSFLFGDIKDVIATIGLRTEFQGFRLSDGSVVNVQILDTAGQERFNAITESYMMEITYQILQKMVISCKQSQ